MAQPELPANWYDFVLVELFEVTWLVFIDEEVSGLHPLHPGKINKASTKSNEMIFIKFFIFLPPVFRLVF